MTEWVTAILLLIGTTFMLLAAVGVLRMPDLFLRLQTATKAVTFGVVFTFLAVAVHFAELGVSFRALLIIAFFFLTSPVAAHRIARAAYFVGVRLWEESVVDELRGRYDPQTHNLESGKVPDSPSPAQQPPSKSPQQTEM
ncbi:MAG: Na+/H+ antiporter subunit G [Acidobacteria bacterium RIFCSPLOWO2_02_FULL_59_13]|nr:MAG: Na+/H+ antiporter subunit G [Acidobacteria bacterium RIFCSPLOWO2_02_FULL_59_13]